MFYDDRPHIRTSLSFLCEHFFAFNFALPQFPSRFKTRPQNYTNYYTRNCYEKVNLP